MAQRLLYFTVAMIVATDIRGNTRKCFQSAFGLKAHLEQRHASVVSTTVCVGFWYVMILGTPRQVAHLNRADRLI
jgi:hypothetical protein